MPRQIVADSYAIIHPHKLVSTLLDELVARVLARIEELHKKEEKLKPSRSPKKSFGTSYAAWLAELDATESCLYVAEGDIDKALHLYWHEDYLLVQEAVKFKSWHESQITLTRLEASMYGTGNKYADDTGGGRNEKTFNLDELSPDEIQAAMANFGF